MARLMGRTPRESTYGEKSHFGKTFSTEEESKIDQPKQSKWRGSGLGQDWDDRVGAGAAAASIVSGRPFFFHCCWLLRLTVLPFYRLGG